MEMTTKKAFDPNQGVYKIELPIISLVKAALLALDYSRQPIKIEDAAGILAEKFLLTNEQKNAKHRNGFNIYKHHIANAAGALVNNGQLVRPKTGWIVNPKWKKDTSTPEELIEENYQKIREGLTEDLLQQIKANSATFFEELVIDLLVAMGYGGSREDAEAVKRTDLGLM